jgi:CheY-like chemotaxis protein
MISILFIEDDPVSGMLYEKVCALYGYRYLLADSGNLGLTMASEIQPDMIVLDLSLPDIDGFQILNRLCQDSKTTHIPVVILSAGSVEELEAVCKSAGAVAYLPKPISLSGFKALIEQYTSE